MADRVAVSTGGLRQFRRELKAVDKALPRELNKELREAVRPIAQDAAALAPHKSGDLAASLRPFALGASVGVRSRLPYAGAVHWGGKVGPGKRSMIPRRTFSLADGTRVTGHAPFIWQAAARNTDELVDAVGDAVENVARRAGWH